MKKYLLTVKLQRNTWKKETKKTKVKPDGCPKWTSGLPSYREVSQFQEKQRVGAEFNQQKLKNAYKKPRNNNSEKIPEQDELQRNRPEKGSMEAKK